jgi:hypothetical protein
VVSVVLCFHYFTDFFNEFVGFKDKAWIAVKLIRTQIVILSKLKLEYLAQIIETTKLQQQQQQQQQQTLFLNKRNWKFAGDKNLDE